MENRQPQPGTLHYWPRGAAGQSGPGPISHWGDPEAEGECHGDMGLM